MADFVKTITNSLNLFGLEYSTKWGEAFGLPYTMVWGTSKWGESGYSVVIDVQKLLTGEMTVTDHYLRTTNKLISNDLSLTEDLSNETLANGIWDYVYPSDTTNAEGRDVPTWSASSSNTTSFTCQAAGSTTWG